MKTITIRTIAEYDALYPQPYMRMFDEETNENYTNGYVVSGYASKDSHHYFATLEEAEQFAGGHRD